MDSLSSEMREFFAVAGVTEAQLADRELREFIFAFLDGHGGIECAVAAQRFIQRHEVRERLKVL